MAALLLIAYTIATVTHGQYTELYYDDMEDYRASGWLPKDAVGQAQGPTGGCEGGCVYIESISTGMYTSIDGSIERTFDIYGYSDLVVSVNIGRTGISDASISYGIDLRYACDPEWDTSRKIGIALSRKSEYSYKNRNFTVEDYSGEFTCSGAKTLNLLFDIWAPGSKGYLDEVRIWYGNTYATTPTPTYAPGVYMYDNMTNFRNTGWVIPCDGCRDHDVQSGNDFCGSDGKCLSISGYGSSLTKSYINTAVHTFAAVQYIVGTEFTVNNHYFVEIQCNCDNGNSFTPIATHFGVTTATQYTVILPCTSTNTEIRIYSYSSNTYTATADFDNICVSSWDETKNEWSTDYCPDSLAWTDYSSSIYWYDDFDNELNQWLVDVPDLMTDAIWIESNTADTVMEGNFIRMSGNDVSITSRAMNGYSLSYPDIQFDIQTDCNRDLSDEILIEYACDLPNYQWHTLTTYYGDIEGKNVIVSTPCTQTPINQIRFRTIADEYARLYIDNVYYCKSGECPGDSMVNPSSEIIFYEKNVTGINTSWVKPYDDTYFRRRFNDLNDCDDLWVQYNIKKGSFESSQHIKVEYKYDGSETESYCSDPVGWTELTTYTGSDFIDQNILQLPCSPQFYGSLSIKFTINGNEDAIIENFYLCNGRDSCPAPFPTMYPSFDPTVIPSNDPTTEPTKYPTLYPTTTPTINPSVNPTKQPTAPTEAPTELSLSGNDGRIIKEGINCFSGYKDVAQNDPNYDILCEQCSDGTAGTYGNCEECAMFQVPNDRRDSCEYFQPWWLWLAETLLGLGIIGIAVWCIKKGKKGKKAKTTQQQMELANTSQPPPLSQPPPPPSQPPPQYKYDGWTR